MASTDHSEPDDSERFDLVVAGGGPAGLAHAFWHRQRHPDARIRVLEARPSAGGWVETVTRDGYQLELGPQGFRPDPGAGADRDLAGPLLHALGLADRVVPCSSSATRRFVVRDGRPHELPTKPSLLLRTKLLSLPQKLRVWWETRVNSRSPEGETVAAFVARRFGKAAVPFAEAMVHGIYAGSAHALEVASALPLATEIEAEHQSLLRGLGARKRQRVGPPQPTVCTFPDGMQETTTALLLHLDGAVTTDAPVDAIERDPTGGFVVHTGAGRTLATRALCLATPPAVSARLLAPLDPELGALVGGVATASVASVHLGYDAAAVPDDVDGFGFLVPQGELGPVLGALFCSHVFPHQAPDGRVLFRVMSGGVAHPDELDRDDDALVGRATAALQDQLGLRADPVFCNVSRARDAIPQYAPGHRRRLEAMRERLEHLPGLSLRGAGYRRIAVVGQWSQQGSAP